jgi:hypothetical protein
MKFTTIYLGENKIEVFNSLLGIEKIIVNGEIVSRKFSIFGAEHYFTIKENDKNVECKIDFGFGINGIVFNLYKDNKPIVESPKNGCLLPIVFFLIVLAIGLMKYFLFD